MPTNSAGTAITSSGTAAGGQAGDRGRRLRRDPVVALCGVVVLLLLAGTLTTASFSTSDNVKALLQDASITGIVAVGSALIMISGKFVSLSVQQCAILAAMLLASTANDGLSPGVAVLLCLGALTIVSLLQGWLVAVGLNPIVTTLAVGSILFGGIAYFAGGDTVTFSTGGLNWLNADLFGIPGQVVVFVCFTAVVTLFAQRTVAGRQISLMGANPETARLSGISVGRCVLIAYFALGVSLTIAGILQASQFGQADTRLFGSLTFNVITAVVVGGIAVQGGEGSPIRAAIGAVIIAIISDILVLQGASRGTMDMVAGALVVFAVLLVHVLRGGAR